MKCVPCGHENVVGSRFCSHCGARLAAAADEGRAYTPAHLAERILTSRSALQGERKPVTVLFCDIADSTGLAERLGAERMHQVLNRFFETALAEVHRFEGTVNQFLGDGFMALFGAPLTHEDHARRAVLAALAIRRAVSQLAVSGDALALRLRTGLNSGAVVVGSIGDNLRMDYTAIGDTTNVAARIQAAAEPGTILVSESVWRATQGFVDARELGPRLFKGKSEPVSLYEVLQARGAARVGAGRQADSGPASLIVGRQAEWTEVRRMLDALQSGRGGVLGIVGDAGLGKSRLMEETCTEARTRGLRWLQGDCLSFGRTLSYWSFREVIRRGFGIDEGDDEARSWQKLHDGMADLFGAQAEELLPYVGSLLALNLPQPHAGRVAHLDGLAMGHQIFRAMYLLVERSAQRRALVVAFEDWHWADTSSGDLLEHLLPLSDRVPVLFVVASRPEPEGPAASFRKAVSVQDDRPLVNARILHLAPLPAADTLDLAERSLGGGALPEPVRAMLLRRSEGNPFYLGELVRNLVGQQALERDAQGDWSTTERYGTLQLPDTIEGLILARIDRLGDEAKQVLKAAAVVGRTFFYRVLKAITHEGAALDGELAQLQKAELIGEKRQVPELEYLFKHPLIQQATYDSLLEERRRQMHRQVGDCIESLYGERPDEFYPVLAYHYARAQAWTKALDYLIKAGNQAGRIAGDAEALEHYELALSAARLSSAELDPTLGAQLQGRIGEALFRLGQHARALEHMRASLAGLGVNYPVTRNGVVLAIALAVARRALRRISPIRRRLLPGRQFDAGPRRALLIELLISVVQIDYYLDPARFVLGTLLGLELAEEIETSAGHAISTAALGAIYDSIGLYTVAARNHAKGAKLAAVSGDPSALGYCQLFKGIHEHSTGRFASAVQALRSSAEHFRATGHLRNLASAQGSNMFVLRSMGDPAWFEVTQQHARIAADTGDHQVLGWSQMGLGMQGMDRSDWAGAAKHLKAAVGTLERVPDFRFLSGTLAGWAHSEMRLGNFRRAIELIERCEAVRKRYRVSGVYDTWTTVNVAEAYLFSLEHEMSDGQTDRIREDAWRSCRRAARHGRLVRNEAAAEALRLKGMFCWIAGDKGKAERLWLEGVALAGQRGANIALAKLHHQLGGRLGRREHSEQATALFERFGAVAPSDLPG